MRRPDWATPVKCQECAFSRVGRCTLNRPWKIYCSRFIRQIEGFGGIREHLDLVEGRRRDRKTRRVALFALAVAMLSLLVDAADFMANKGRFAPNKQPTTQARAN